MKNGKEAGRGSEMELFTIGVYGYSEDAFFDSLTTAGIDTFCDIRRRRGVRGSDYAFANATWLQEELAKRGVRYLHLLQLAPTQEVRERQAAVDVTQHVARRKREELSPEFIDAYRACCLSTFDSYQFVRDIGPDARRVALFCVERTAAACHRSLVAARIAEDLGVAVTHLQP